MTLYNDGTVAVIDPTTLAVKPLASVGGSPCGLAWINGTLWIALVGSNSVVEIDPSSGRLVRTVQLKGSPWDLQPGAGALWVVDRGIPGVARIDPKTGRIVASVKTPGTPVGLAIVAGHPWVAGYGPAELDRLNAQGTAIYLRTTTGLGPSPTWFADGDGSLWVADNGGGVTRIEPSTGKVVASVPLAGVPRDPVVAFGALWVANSADGVLSRIDLATNQVTAQIQLQLGIWVVEQVGKEIWVENFSGTQIDRIDPTLVR